MLIKICIYCLNEIVYKSPQCPHFSILPLCHHWNKLSLQDRTNWGAEKLHQLFYSSKRDLNHCFLTRSREKLREYSILMLWSQQSVLEYGALQSLCPWTDQTLEPTVKSLCKGFPALAWGLSRLERHHAVHQKVVV